MENGYCGIFGANRTEVLVRNNILMGNKQFGIFLGPEARKTRIVGNNIYANRHPFNDNADNQTIRQQNISENPQFVSAGFPLHNYAIKSGSPLRGRGEEGVDIGLNESLSMASASASQSSGGLGRLASSLTEAQSDLDNFFGTPAPATPSAPPPPPAPAPAADAPWAITETVVLTEDAVNFSFMSADLSPSSFPILDELVRSLSFHTNIRVEIAGHTDNQGDEEFNKSLSFNRARAVLNYFVSKGISRDRLVARGYGMERPIDSNETESGRASNRRVEVIPLR
jgi:OOP family OmpA-OmpF porin